MPLARRAAVALAVMGAGVLAYAVPATATGKDNGSNKQCVSGRDASNLDWHLNARAGTVTVSARGGKSFCRDVSVVLSIYKVPDTWNGTGFNQTAVPQHKFAPHAMGKLHRKDTLELRVPVPTCGNAQIDLYYPPTQDDVDINGTARFIGGDIFSIGGENGHPASCTPPVETTTPPVETTTPPPVESSSPPVESSSPPPVESSSPPVESSSPPVESSSPPATSPAAVVTVVPTETVPPIAAPIPVLPQSPPRLAETGSNSTIPLLGLGSLLLLAGIGLSLAGRGKPKATPAA